MVNYQRIFKVFIEDPNITIEKETFDSLDASCTSTEIRIVDEGSFNDIKNCYSDSNDDIYIRIGIEGFEEGEYEAKYRDYSYDAYLKTFENIRKLSDDEDDDYYKVSIHIEKSLIDKSPISVYSIDLLTSYLEDLDLAKLLLTIKEKVYDKKRYLLFMNDVVETEKTGIIITNKKLDNPINETLFEDKEHCHCIVNNNSLLLPLYYKKNSNNNRLFMLLNKLAAISAICHLSTYSEIRNNSVFVKCSGYKTIFGEIKWSKELEFNNEIFRICAWVYDSNNIEDKRGLFLNILSLNINAINELLLLENDIYDAVISSHEIYLRNNVNQYIHIKSVFIEQQIAMLANINEIIDTIIESFKKNYTGFFAFLISVVVLNSISSGKIDNIFNNTITIITFVLLAISMLLLLLSIIEIVQKWKRQKEIIENTKKEYSDVLNNKDIDNIFNKSVNLQDAKKTLIKNTVIISSIWVISIIVILIAVKYLNGIWHPNTNIEKLNI